MQISINRTIGTNLLAAAVFCAGIFALCSFPLYTIHKIWKDYRVLVVSLSESETDIVSRLKSKGIVDIVTAMNSMLLNTNQEAPIEPFLPTINAERTGWFINTEHNCRYLFLRDQPFLTAKTAESFSGTDFFWVLEKTGGMNPLPPLFVIIVFLAGLFFVKNRLFQIAGGCSFILLAISCNRPSGFFAAILFLYTGILLADHFERQCGTLTGKQLISRLLADRVILILLLAALVAGFSGGFQAGFLSIAALAVSLSGVSLFGALRRFVVILRNKQRLHPIFIPVHIRQSDLPASLKKKTILGISTLVPVLLISGTLALNTGNRQMETQFGKDLYIPAPSGYTDHSGFTIESYTDWVTMKSAAGLPDLGDFVSVQWHIQTFPWRRLQTPTEKPDRDSTAEYPDYVIDEKGIISEKNRIMAKFDTDFIRKTLSSDSTPLEKMLLRQNRFVTVNLMRLK